MVHILIQLLLIFNIWLNWQVEEVYNFSQDDLLTEDILILDTHAEIFIWVGQSVDPKEKQSAFEIGQVLPQLCLVSESTHSLFTLLINEVHCRNILRWLYLWRVCLRMCPCTKSQKEMSLASSQHFFHGILQKQLYVLP